jgi:hypothetical protein
VNGEPQWALYGQVLDRAMDLQIPFAIGGGFAVSNYTGRPRDTKDLDIYVLPENRDAMIAVLTELGLVDYFDTKPYDRWWIYRGTRDGFIVDIIWAMANHRQQIDDLWMSGPFGEMAGRRVKVLPAEAILWDKLYIVQRERCDWPDVLNLLYATGGQLDWEYLLHRIGDDHPLVAGVLSVFRWAAPGCAAALPRWIWERVGLVPPCPDAAPEIDARAVSLIDRRPWFGPPCEPC